MSAPKPPPLPDPYSVPHVYVSRFLGSMSVIRSPRKQAKLNERGRRLWLKRHGRGDET